MSSPIRILHLEDDPADARLIQDLIRDDGLEAEITTVGDRRTFLSALKRDEFDLMLADFKLPGYDGLQALAEWRAQRPGKPFILVTGSMGEELAVESLRNGAIDYVLKANLARLLPAVRRALAEADERARRQQAEEELRLANQELTRVCQVIIGRERRIIELNKQVNKLCARLGEPRVYRTDFEPEPSQSAA